VQTPRRTHERSGKKIYRATTPPPNFSNLLTQEGIAKEIKLRSKKKPKPVLKSKGMSKRSITP